MCDILQLSGICISVSSFFLTMSIVICYKVTLTSILGSSFSSNFGAASAISLNEKPLQKCFNCNCVYICCNYLYINSIIHKSNFELNNTKFAYAEKDFGGRFLGYVICHSHTIVDLY